MRTAVPKRFEVTVPPTQGGRLPRAAVADGLGGDARGFIPDATPQDGRPSGDRAGAPATSQVVGFSETAMPSSAAADLITVACCEDVTIWIVPATKVMSPPSNPL